MGAPPSSSVITVKGIRDGLLITLAEEGAWDAVHTALLTYIGEQATFFQGARVALDVGQRALRAAQLGKLRDDLAELGITLWAVLSTAPRTQANARALGLATQVTTPHQQRPRQPRRHAQQLGEEALFIPRTLRSGMRVEHAGHVVVLGNVHPGAEIIATGHIIVWGRLQGIAHAGAEGDESATVCALELVPTQLRIATVIATMPPRQHPPGPERAYLKDGQIIAEPWRPT